MANTKRPIKYFWTLPFGARTANGNVSPSPFFSGRHTYQLATSGVNGELSWLIVNRLSGGLLPRVTTKEDLVREVGIFQDGATAVVLKIPVRNHSLEVTLRGDDSMGMEEIMLRLGYIFSPHHSTASVPPGYEEVNQLFDVANRWGRPNPFTFTKVKPDGTAYHLDCFVQTADPQDTVSPDGFSINTSIRLSSDEPFWYGDEIEEELSGLYGTGQITEPESVPIYFLDQNVPNPVNYSADTLASARTCFVMSMPLALATPQTLYSFGIYETNTNSFSRFKHADYPNGGWTLPAGALTLVFDSCNRTLIATYSTGTQLSLELESSPESSWSDFELVPGFSYKFFLELTEPTGLGTGIPSTITYKPQWMSA